jgi:hypothetical protein
MPDFLTFSSKFGREVGLSVKRPLHTQDNTAEKDEDKILCFEWDSCPRSQSSSGQDPRLSQRGHCEWRH